MPAVIWRVFIALFYAMLSNLGWQKLFEIITVLLLSVNSGCGGIFSTESLVFHVSLKLSSYVHIVCSSLLMKAANGRCASMQLEETHYIYIFPSIAAMRKNQKEKFQSYIQSSPYLIKRVHVIVDYFTVILRSSGGKFLMGQKLPRLCKNIT